MGFFSDYKMWFEQRIENIRKLSDHYFSKSGIFEKYLNKIQHSEKSKTQLGDDAHAR